MFSKELSASVLSICDSRSLSYEAASELCDLSARYFGAIARGQTSPSVDTLEKLCAGLDRTPNELLGFSTADGELSYRFSRQVVHYERDFSPSGSCRLCPVCPRCHCKLGCERQAFCDRCGQKLGWDCFRCAAPDPER